MWCPKGIQQLRAIALTIFLTAVTAATLGTFGPPASLEEVSPGSRGIAGKDQAADFIANPPARYAQIPMELRLVLARSILDKSLPYPAEATHMSVSLWDYLDNWMAASQIQTLMEVHREGTSLGVWPAINRIRKVYTGSSWGIQFSGPVDVLEARSKQKDICHDIDWIVRRDHGNTKHTWWRFIPGWDGVGYAHLGIGAGQDYHDLHFDSTNPATERLGVGDTCNYGVVRVIKHNVEIRMVDVTMTGAVRGFLLIERAHYIHQRVLGVIDHDLLFSPPTSHYRWTAVQKRLTFLKAQRDQINQDAHAIAATQDGFDTVHKLVSTSLTPFVSKFNEDLLLFIQTIKEEGLDNGYFGRELGAMSLKFIRALRSMNGIKIDGLPSGPTNLAGVSLPKSSETDIKNMTEYEQLLELQELLEKKGALALSPANTDALVGFFERIRKKP